MKIVTLKVKNYKVFRNLELRNLPVLAVFVGANGAGKTTLFDIFGFLKDALNGNVRSALQKRGGFREVIARGQSGDIEIEIQFKISGARRDRLLAYQLIIGEEKNTPVVKREILRYARPSGGAPHHFLDFGMGEGCAVSRGGDSDKQDAELVRETQQLDSPDILALKGLGQFSRYQAANALRKFIESWQVSDFDIAEARPSREIGCGGEHLSPNGDNLPLAAKYMREHAPALYNEVLGKMSERVPGVDAVEAETTIDGRIALLFRDNSFKDPFIAGEVSDGTIKMFAYLLLLHDPKPPPMLCIEEPENHLYPHLLYRLLEEFRDYAHKGGQLFLSTHSPDMVNAAEPAETYWLIKEGGCTAVKRASDDEMISVLHDEGDQLGYLWSQKYFAGAL